MISNRPSIPDYLSNLANGLLREAAFIDGQWQEVNPRFSVFNPATGELLAEVADCGGPETQKAIEAADRAFQAWSKRTAYERALVLKRWAALCRQHEQDLAKLLTAEQGKPLKEALGEIRYGANYMEWFAEEGPRAYGDIIPGQATDKRIMVIKQAVGVVAAITPWNFPFAMIARKVAPALAAGCTVVVKPAEDTPLSALALASLADEAGFPAGSLNIVPTSTPETVGDVLTSSPTVRKLSFTGSTEVGRLLMKQCAPTLKRLSLELGGNAPFIVFDDADIEAAVQGALASKYRNAGQTCVCANRIYVQKGVAHEFTEALSKATATLRVGNGLEDGHDIGPLINDQALHKVEALVEDAVGKGARVLNGGKAIKRENGVWFEPTVLDNASAEMRVSSEEIFGPVAPVYTFNTEAEAIELANASEHGLAAYFFGRDYARIWRVAEALEYGMVGVNTGLLSSVMTPFGGVKQSGFGREGSKYGIQEYLQLKYVCIGGVE